MSETPIAAVVGIGPGNGESLVRKFHSEGYRVAMLTRSRDTLDRYEHEFVNARGFPCDKPDDFFLDPDDIALTVFELLRQPRSAWSFEIDVRPFGEDW